MREYSEMKKEIKTPKTSVHNVLKIYPLIIYKKQWKRIASVVKNILLTKIQVLEKLNKVGQCFY